MLAAVKKIPGIEEVVLMEDVDPTATFDGGDCFYTGEYWHYLNQRVVTTSLLVR